MGDFDYSQGGQGAAGGAMTGAAIGTTILPGWGTVIGAGVGAIGGFFAGGFSGDPKKDYEKLFKKLAAGYQPHTVGAAAQAGQSSLVQNRAALIAQLEAQARGEGPSAARLQMQQGMARAAAAQTSAAQGAGGRGVNAGAALRNATNNSAAIMMQGNQDMGVMRAQEQLDAVSQLGQNISQGVQADNALNTWNAGARNQQEQFNAQQLSAMDDMQLRTLLAAAGMTPAVPMGSSLLAGGASTVPAMMQTMQANRQQTAAAQQQAQYQQQQTQQAQAQQQAYTQSLQRQTPQAPAAPPTNFWTQVPFKP